MKDQEEGALSSSGVGDEANLPATLDEMATALRALSIDAIEAANSGHPGLPLGAADIVTVLFSRIMRFDASDPLWHNRDRFVLSAGHGSMILYGAMHLLGYEEATLEDVKRFRQMGSRATGHPEFGLIKGIETTTGPLGQGLANAVGMAIAERHLAAVEREDLVDHDTYVLVGDGCLMEGISQEAISLAGHLKLRRLTVLMDDNNITIDGPVNLSDSTHQLHRFAASGWGTWRVDGHDKKALEEVMREVRNDERPSIIACRTTIGYGSPNRAGTAQAHGVPLGPQEAAATREKLGWKHPPFEIPSHIRAAWEAVGRNGETARKDWQSRVDALDPAHKQRFLQRLNNAVPSGWRGAVRERKSSWLEEAPSMATRIASQEVLRELVPRIPELIGGSADTSGSNSTKVEAHEVMSASDYKGRYIHYGVREHAIGAMMNGMRLHGGVIPYSGAYLAFSDYLRPTLRLAAMMKQRVIHVFTHDSIGTGEDGPTHQQVEHLASLRAIPGLWVLRPADAVETAECWEMALERQDGPCALVLTRQSVPTVRKPVGDDKNRCTDGAYVLADSNESSVTIFASGSEVAVALEARRKLALEKVIARVVSVPCLDIFWQLPEEKRQEIVGPEGLKVVVEAGCSMGWDALIGGDGVFVGINDYGASAPGAEVFVKFGLTADNVAAKVLAAL